MRRVYPVQDYGAPTAHLHQSCRASQLGYTLETYSHRVAMVPKTYTGSVTKSRTLTANVTRGGDAKDPANPERCDMNYQWTVQ